jgi:hypothetical protein
MAHVWGTFGPGMDSGMGELKEELIGKNAKGIVFEIGAGNNTTALPCRNLIFSLFSPESLGLKLALFQRSLYHSDIMLIFILYIVFMFVCIVVTTINLFSIFSSQDTGTQ